MNGAILYTVIVLVSIGAIAAVILYIVSKKFQVKEDPRLQQLMDALPNTNCGGCGFPGCSAFADVLVKAEDLKPYHCPVGGNDVMKEVAEILGKEVEEKDPYIAVVRCSGSFEARKQTSIYDGAPSCTIAAQLYSGDRGCAYGCVGLGECVDACDFEAMYMDLLTGLPVVIADKCTACNACVRACPKDIIQLWPKGRKNERIYVACVNEERSGVARQECGVSCSGCAKCFDACRYDAITVENNLAVIDPEKCKLCAECIGACDVRNIIAVNIPADKLEKAEEKRLKRIEKLKQKKKEERENAEIDKIQEKVGNDVETE